MKPSPPPVPPAAGGSLSEVDRLELRARLEARADALREELDALERERSLAPLRTPVDEVEDSGEQGEHRTRSAVRDAERDRDVGELRDIAAALMRMDQGDYGNCEDCGLAIPLARLKVQPSAARCIECQERHERAHPAEVKAAPLH